MKPNHIYQATVEALESVLAPRVVSLVLREGLGRAGRAPADMALEDVEAVLTEPAFRQLQALMPADQARAAVTSFLERITAAVAAPAPDAHAADAAGDVAGAPHLPRTALGAAGTDQRDPDAAAGRIGALRAALRPFNLYFDWPEVRKLRAQLQVAEQELAGGLPASASLDEAAEQLQLVEQKLEDRLVLQARELGELEEAFEVVASLGGPRVRRLEALIGQIRQAQRDRELAEGEVQRAAGIARDLRKLMESSVALPLPERGDPSAAAAAGAGATAADDDLAPVTIDAALLTPEVSERLRRLDVEAERKQLDALEAHHEELLRYLPSLAERFARARTSLDRERLLGEDLEQLRQTLDDATATQRLHLRLELEAVAEQALELHEEDDGRLERAVTIALDVLREGLPPFADVAALRDLHRSAVDRAEERTRREADARAHQAGRREHQRAALERLIAAAERDPGESSVGLAAPRQALHAALAALRAAEAADHLDEGALEQANQAEQRWEHALVERADGAQERLHARLRQLDARLSALPDTPGLRARGSALRREVVDALAEEDLGDAHVVALASLIEQLHADAVAEHARQLDVLGKEAGDVSSPTVLQALQAAARALQAGRFADLGQLRGVVAAEREQARARDQARWQRLQQARLRFESAGVAGLLALASALDAAREALAGGRPADRALSAAEAALEQVEAQVRSRSEHFGPRLDAALATFWKVERLNNDDVANVRRVLTHLDSQRDALARVSPGLQHQLERALAGAEQLLERLAEAYEATRVVADQLVAGNLLDDVLGTFDDVGPAPAGAAASTAAADGEAPPATTAAAARRRREALQVLIAGFRGLDDVDAAAVVDAAGVVHAGDLGPLDQAPLLAALHGAAESWQALGAPLGDEPELVDLALGDRHALLMGIGGGSHVLLVVRNGGAISALGARLRGQRRALAETFAAASPDTQRTLP